MQTFKQHYNFKLFLAFLSLVAVLCMVPHVAIHAEVNIPKPKQTIYLSSKNGGYDYDADPEEEWVYFITESDKDQYLVEPSLRTDNDSVVSGFGWGGYGYRSDLGRYENFLSVKPWKPGTAKMSFEDKQGKTYSVVLKALPYENPIKSLKITNINKGKNLAKKVNESFQYNSQKGEQGGLIFPKKTASPKIKLEAKTGWKIKKITAKYSGHEEYANNVNAQTKTMKLKEADKGAELWLHITFKNTDNGAAIRIVFGDLWYED